ncbi:MAG: hypothetical protein E7Z95_12615 [Actinomyces succiniciruminis]|nr:hypothetical protein [Actinomyces succiniciruminis]
MPHARFVAGSRRRLNDPLGRHAEVRKDKGMARELSEILESLAQLIRAIGVLVDALSKWFS